MRGNGRIWKHGTEYAYRMKCCRCEDCVSARARRETVKRMAKRGRAIEDEQGGRVHVDLPYKPGPLARVLRALNDRLATLEADLEAQREKVRSISNLYANERDEAEELAGLLGECRNDVLFNALRLADERSAALVQRIDAALARRK